MALPALPNMNRELVSSQKAAHDALDGAAYRKFGYLARFSRDVGGDRWSPLLNLEGYQSECSGIPPTLVRSRERFLTPLRDSGWMSHTTYTML
jgi:hypothetical protein